MLGTPNGGSHAITELLSGSRSCCASSRGSTSATAGGTAAHHRAVSRRARDAAGGTERRRLFLPRDVGRLPRAHRRRRRLAAAGRGRSEGGGGGPPRARRVRRRSGAHDLRGRRRRRDDRGDEAHLRPVAKRDRIEFLATTRGDGRVTWDSGIRATSSAARPHFAAAPCNQNDRPWNTVSIASLRVAALSTSPARAAATAANVSPMRRALASWSDQSNRSPRVGSLGERPPSHPP